MNHLCFGPEGNCCYLFSWFRMLYCPRTLQTQCLYSVHIRAGSHRYRCHLGMFTYLTSMFYPNSDPYASFGRSGIMQ